MIFPAPVNRRPDAEKLGVLRVLNGILDRIDHKDFADEVVLILKLICDDLLPQINREAELAKAFQRAAFAHDAGTASLGERDAAYKEIGRAHV